MGPDAADRGPQRRYPPSHPCFRGVCPDSHVWRQDGHGNRGLQVLFQGLPSEVLPKQLRWWVRFLVFVVGGGQNDLPEV